MFLSNIFKRNGIGQALVILLVAAAMWVPAFVSPVVPAATDHFAPIYNLICGWLSATPILSSVIALLLVIAEGLWINVILYNFKLSRTGSLMPLLLYIVAMSWRTSYLTLTPMLLANIAIIAACRQLLSSGSLSMQVPKIFNATFCIGMAAMCYMPALCYAIPFLFVVILYKMYRWRDIAAAILGLTAPCIILFVYAFMTDRLDYYLLLIFADFNNLQFRIDTMTTLSLIRDIVFILLLLASLTSQLTSMGDNMIHQRINTGILTLPLLAALVLMLDSICIPVDTISMSIPFCFVTTRFLYIERKRAWINEVLFWLILIIAIV